MSDIVLCARDVSKKFTRSLKRSLYYGLRDIFSELGGRSRHSSELRKEEFWALEHVSFELRKGEALGLVGPNGSGKTTLLRLIGGLLKMDSGEIRIRGRVAPLIALGAGFNPVLTGRENIYVNMAILGLTHAQIGERFEEVVSFAEIGDAMDAPVQTYSSGMAARLGFACAVHTEPDILLVDEVLSVGDMRFRSKCYRKLSELRQQGTSFILVSHNSAAILSISNRVLYLRNGNQVLCGDPERVLTQYQSDLYGGEQERALSLLAQSTRGAGNDTGVRILEIFLTGSDGERQSELKSGERGTIQVRVQIDRAVHRIVLAALIREVVEDMPVVQNLSSDRDGVTFDLEYGVNTIGLALPPCNFRPGIYAAKIFLTTATYYTYDAVENFVFRVVSDRPLIQSLFFQPREWVRAQLSASSVEPPEES